MGRSPLVLANAIRGSRKDRRHLVGLRVGHRLGDRGVADPVLDPTAVAAGVLDLVGAAPLLRAPCAQLGEQAGVRDAQALNLDSLPLRRHHLGGAL